MTRRELANAIRALSMDAVQQARSGHPGAPMGMADIAQVLWCDFLKHNPNNPRWADRDRFVLSNGHASMLLYSLLHLTGYPLPIDQLRNFRQMGAHTAGHPEVEPELGIETTTGPLGQGVANAVGMALAEKILANRFNRPGHDVIDHYTWVFLGDGCLMEGVSHEACSLAGTLGLGKLICLYDDNGISIDGKVKDWFTDDTPGRFRAYGWHVVEGVDGHDPEAIGKAITAARAEQARPSLICCKTVIGWGAPNKQGSESTHGAPLGEEEVAAAREFLGWPYAPFEIPDEISAQWNAQEAGAAAEQSWRARFEAYRQAHADLAGELERRLRGDLPEDWRATLDEFIARAVGEAPSVATRVASQKVLDALGPEIPEMLGGSADLTGSNNTRHKTARTVTPEQIGGDYIHYGVREFGMTAIMNGISLHGGFIPFGGTFLVFSDYARNAVRMAALMKQGVILVYTHDSIGLGEDGPTHQPVEHMASLRLIPGMRLWRPCDMVETAVAWGAAIDRRDGPTCLVLTRQGLPMMQRTAEQLANVARGGYVLKGTDARPDCVIVATGSEIALATEAASQLDGEGVTVQVVSMPCTSVFDGQSQQYRDKVLPPGVPRVAVEAGSRDGWWRYVSCDGAVLGIDSFGASAPAGQLFEHYGFTPENLIRIVKDVLRSD